MRQRDLHILTSGLHTYTNDWRISAVHVTVRQPPHGGPVVPANGEDVSSSPSFAPVANGNAAMASSASRNASGPADSSSSVWDDEDGVWSEWTLVTFKWFFCFVLIWFSFFKKNVFIWHGQRIRSTEAKDAGLYECQVSTEPKISKIYRLHVVGKPPSELSYVIHFCIQ